jgi:Domain of unknown function (DUF4864)
MEITDSDVYDEIHLHVIIRSIIEQQLQAFQSDNSAAAFALASPDIQAQFQTPENFMKMVKTGYLPVYRPRSVVFEGMSTIQGNITITPISRWNSSEGNIFDEEATRSHMEN